MSWLRLPLQYTCFRITPLFLPSPHIRQSLPSSCISCCICRKSPRLPPAYSSKAVCQMPTYPCSDNISDNILPVRCINPWFPRQKSVGLPAPPLEAQNQSLQAASVHQGPVTLRMAFFFFSVCPSIISMLTPPSAAFLANAADAGPAPITITSQIMLIYFYFIVPSALNTGSFSRHTMSSLSAASPSARTVILPTMFPPT